MVQRTITGEQAGMQGVPLSIQNSISMKKRQLKNAAIES